MIAIRIRFEGLPELEGPYSNNEIAAKVHLCEGLIHYRMQTGKPAKGVTGIVYETEHGITIEQALVFTENVDP